ncbi:NAD(P)H-hydrate dehydratase [Pseudoalteromonas sp. MMG013]|uniref:NAD(P)H-hydrate dehydratase n=1 Tax=Pseudoalteromonas sp. MMG013 TaxID=2822687 RepID=UPI001B377DCA|nr:NAD(P)H-hydrate dehydratase [Pseudoalteromonas sp. MMG013]MBQ4861213.1 NAD(P)H-hydrate dehydratase [Pseudoalteromonas sp. MMG013]
MEAKYHGNLPQFAYTAQQVKDNEGQAASEIGISLSHLMERAADAVFSLFDHELLNAERILILAGKGNNAGDAYLLARLLHMTGRVVSVMSLFSPQLLTGDAQSAYEKAVSAKVPFIANFAERGSYDVIVDGVFGTGYSGELSASIKTIFDYCNCSSAMRLSIDVPSGIDASSGVVAEGAFEATITMTFIALKQGMLTGRAKHFCGKLLFAPLGIAEIFSARVKAAVHYSAQQTFMAQRLNRDPDCYKNQCGHVLLIGGNKGMGGAIRLASEACLRAGAGLVSVLTHADNVALVQQGRYELMVHGVRSLNSEQEAIDNLFIKADVLVIGPGLGQDAWAQTLFKRCFEFERTIVCDADGLNLLANTQQRFSDSVITPHIGEAKRLIGNDSDIELSDRFMTTSFLAHAYHSTVVLKGPGSIVYHCDRMNINRSGSSAMASAGMGDVLSGIIAGLLAQGMEKFAATSLAVYIHGLAAEKAATDGEKGLLASDLFEHIRRLLG